MKKIFLLGFLLLLLASCTAPTEEDVQNEPPVSEVTPPAEEETEEPVIEEPVVEDPVEEPEPPIDEVAEPEEEEEPEPPIVEPEEEEVILVIPEGSTVIVSTVSIPDEEIKRLFGIDEWVMLEEFNITQLMPASHVVIIYNEELLKQIAPIAFGVAQLNPMDVSVREFQDKRFTLIYPGVDQQTEAFMNALTPELLSQVGDNFIPLDPIIENLYPRMQKYGKVGVLTSFAPVNGSAPFLPRGTHQIFNDPTAFFEADLDTRLIIYPRDHDLGVPPSRFGKSLNPGDIEGFTDNDGIRTILVRERFGERLEWFFLSDEVLGINGRLNSQEVTNAFQVGGPLYRGVNLNFTRRPFTPRDVAFQGELTPLSNVVSPIDFCRIQQTNRPISPHGHPDTNANLGFPLDRMCSYRRNQYSHHRD